MKKNTLSTKHSNIFCYFDIIRNNSFKTLTDGNFKPELPLIFFHQEELFSFTVKTKNPFQGVLYLFRV